MQDERNDGDDQQNVDQPSRDVEGKEAQEPQHQQDQENEQKHGLDSFRVQRS